MTVINQIDINENILYRLDYRLLEILLKDRSSGSNIIWATDNYAHKGEGFQRHDHIEVSAITGHNYSIVKPRVEKSKKEQVNRIKQKAEVFTPSWICNKQNNLIDTEWFGSESVFNSEQENNWIATKGKIVFPQCKGKTWEDYVQDVRLEIACGEAPYLVSRYDTVTGEYIEPYVIKYNMKPQTLLVDFMPDRMFRMQEQKSQIYNVNVDEAGNSRLEERIREELRVSPIIVMNNEKMEQVQASDILHAVSEYSKTRGVAEETSEIPVDLSLLSIDVIRSVIEQENEIGSKAGFTTKAHDGEGEGCELDTPENSTGNATEELETDSDEEQDIESQDAANQNEKKKDPIKQFRSILWSSLIRPLYVRIAQKRPETACFLGFFVFTAACIMPILSSKSVGWWSFTVPQLHLRQREPRNN